jgi:hypothetical protein
MLMVKHEASGHGFTTRRKMLMVKQEVSGHDFSRADSASKYPGL